MDTRKQHEQPQDEGLRGNNTMDNQLLERLELTAENPDLGIVFTNEELVKICCALSALVKTQKIGSVDGKSGKDGERGLAGLDGTSGKDGNKGNPGKDAIVTSEMLSEIAAQAVKLVQLPDFDALVEERITANPLAVRDAVELLPPDELFHVESIDGLADIIEELRKMIGRASQAGGVSVNKVLSLIEEHNDGEQTYSYVAKTSNYTLKEEDNLVDCNGTFTITLPTAVGFTSEYIIKNSGNGIITISTTSSQTIDGDSTTELNEKDAAVVRSNGSNWIIK